MPATLMPATLPYAHNTLYHGSEMFITEQELLLYLDPLQFLKQSKKCKNALQFACSAF